MRTCLRQTHHRSFLKDIRLLILLLALIVLWHFSSIKAAAAPDLSPERIELAAPGIAPRRLEATLAVSQAITSTLSSQAATAAICPPPAEVTPDLSQSLFARGLFGLTQVVLSGAEPTEPINLLLLGSDSRPGEKYGHTDQHHSTHP